MDSKDVWEIIHRVFVDVTSLVVGLTGLIVSINNRKGIKNNTHRIRRLEGARRKGGETAPNDEEGTDYANEEE